MHLTIKTRDIAKSKRIYPCFRKKMSEFILIFRKKMSEFIPAGL